jgi:hypothetical protein
MALRMSIGGRGLICRERSGKLLISFPGRYTAGDSMISAAISVFLQSMKKRLFFLVLLAAGVSACCAQATPMAPDAPIVDSSFVSTTVASLQSLIEQKYFDEAAIPRINASLGAALARGDFSREKDLSDFAAQLTATLYQASHDKHLFVAVSGPSNSGSDKVQMTRAESARLRNYGVKSARVLDGNVGYLEITGFYRADEGAETVDAAMRFLAHTDALILDFRVNGGGSPDTALQLLSYFFSESNLSLFSIVPRSGAPIIERTVQTGVAYRDETRPVYALVSAQTWSAGEGVPFILQERHRAKVIGEKTAGAANPAAPWTINQALTVTIPFGHIKSSVEGKNWEGTGVVPDTIVSPEKAIQAAYVQALEGLLARTASIPQRQMISNALANARK